MPCKSCQSHNQSPFRGEVNIHFPGIVDLDMRSVLVFPELVVCLDCGFTEFSIPEAELYQLANTPRNSTAKPKATRPRKLPFSP